MRKLLYIDGSFTLSQIRARGLEHVLQVRFLNGYFDHVWSAHPVDTHPASDPDADSIGAPIFERLGDGHVFVRGRYGRFKLLSRLIPLNALLALGSFVLSLILLARREKIKIIRAGDPLLCGIIGLVVARVVGASLVIRIPANNDMIRASIGTPIQPRFMPWIRLEEWLENYVLSRADAVIAPSADYRDFAIRKGTPASSVFLVGYGNLIDPRHLVSPEDRDVIHDTGLLGVLRSRPWMVHLGRLQKLKRAEDCYDVLRLIKEKDSDAGLLLIGDGPLRETIANRAVDDGLSDRVIFLGNIDQGAIARILPYCTLALSPLTGRALAEVAFAALPIVAYDLDWQREMVETGVTGILVPPGKIQAMADGAEYLLSNPAIRDKFGAEARHRAFDLLAPQEQTRRESAVYSRLLARMS